MSLVKRDAQKNFFFYENSSFFVFLNVARIFTIYTAGKFFFARLMCVKQKIQSDELSTLFDKITGIFERFNLTFSFYMFLIGTRLNIRAI